MPNAESGGPGEGGPPPSVPADSDLFELLGNEVRLGILRELRAAEDGGPITFSRLRERVGVGDSGRFNYHLARLQGSLVGKRQEGYVLTAGGRAVTDLLDAEPDLSGRP
jgi:DNA-binding transcriptional ArsR family regulator